MASLTKISPCLWFEDRAEDAANFYVSVFPNARVHRVTHYGFAGQAIHGRAPGSVMTVDFELDGLRFTALNGGPAFSFTEAISLQVMCDSQAELDHFWQRLSEEGDSKAQQCGWLKDRFGLSWQIVPTILSELVGDPDPARADRVMSAMLRMKKLSIAELERAAA